MATKIWGVGGTLFIQRDTIDSKPNTIEYSGFDGISDDTVRIVDLIQLKRKPFDILIADVTDKAGAPPTGGNDMVSVLEHIANERAV